MVPEKARRDQHLLVGDGALGALGQAAGVGHAVPRGGAEDGAGAAAESDPPHRARGGDEAREQQVAGRPGARPALIRYSAKQTWPDSFDWPYGIFLV